MTAAPAKKHALYFKGDNPTADIVLLRRGAKGPEVLLIVRGSTVLACPGLPAFPAGFIEAADDKAEFHVATESADAAARRELLEETGLVAGSDIELIPCGAWEAPWRDPRNSEDRRVKSHVFCAWAPEGFGPEPQGLDDAEPKKTAWVALSELAGVVMAFDHGTILSAVCATLGAPDPGARSWSLERLWKSLDAGRDDRA